MVIVTPFLMGAAPLGIGAFNEEGDGAAGAEEDVSAVVGAATARRRRTRRRPACVRGRGGRYRGRRSKLKGFGSLRRMRDSGGQDIHKIMEPEMTPSEGIDLYP